MSSERTFDARVIRGTVRLDGPVPANVGAFSTVPWQHAERGPVRLVVDVPALRGRLILAISSIVGVFALLLLAAAALVSVALGDRVPAFDSRFVIAVVIGACALDAVLLALLRAGSAHETLEIDSRFVSLRRGGKLLGLWDRTQAGEFTKWAPPDQPWRVWVSRWFLDRPTVMWGSVDCPGWTGSGISDAAAEALLETISAFCRDNPGEPGFTYHPGSIPM